VAIEALRTAWINAPAVTSLIAADKIEPLRRTQGIGLPGIALQIVSDVPFVHLGGDAGLDANLVQADFYGTDYTALRAIADACKTAGFNAGFVMQIQFDNYDSDTDPELYQITQTWSVFT
jgi:hypothetical protein